MDKKFIYIAGGGLLLVIILIIVLVVGKGKNADNTPKSNVMTIWDYNNEKAAYDPVILAYQQTKNIKVNYVSKNPNSYLEDTVSAMAAGTGPDVWVVPADILPKYKSMLQPMPQYGFADNSNKKSDTEVYSSLFPQVVSQQNIIDGKIYGVPITIDKLRLFVNPKIVNEGLTDYYKANPDSDLGQLSQTVSKLRTWDDLVQAVRIITKKENNNISRSAIALGTSKNIPASNDILTLIMMQNGAKMVSDDLSTAQFHTKQNIFSNIDYPGTKALEFYTGFANSENKNYTWNNSIGNARRAFAEGKSAMLIDYESAEKEITNITPNLSFQMFDVPQIKEAGTLITLVKYDTLVVPKSSKMQALAWRFVLTATGNTFYSTIADISKKTSILGNTDKEISNAKAWYNPDPTKVKDIFNDIVTQVNSGNDAQTAMDGAAGQVTTLLGKLKTP